MKRLLSSGILMWRRRNAGEVEVLLAHFGGPMWARRDAGAWAIPKGIVEPGEALEAAARREFEEELGTRPEGELVPLGRIRQKSGKYVEAFALEGDLDADAIRSMTMQMEWPPRSGKFAEFPEIDRAAWYDMATARAKILPSQEPILDRFEEMLGTLPTRSG